PFLGTAPGGSHFGFSGDSGDVFPGAAVPLGMVQFSADTPSRLPGGYNFLDTRITGLSLTHFSGRGCTAYQDLPLMPYVGQPLISPALSPAAYWSRFSHRSEEAHPGYYRVHLDGPGVTAELTATARSGLARFTFPSSTRATLLLDASGSVNG